MLPILINLAPRPILWIFLIAKADWIQKKFGLKICKGRLRSVFYIILLLALAYAGLKTAWGMRLFFLLSVVLPFVLNYRNAYIDNSRRRLTGKLIIQTFIATFLEVTCYKALFLVAGLILQLDFLDEIIFFVLLLSGAGGSVYSGVSHSSGNSGSSNGGTPQEQSDMLARQNGFSSAEDAYRNGVYTYTSNDARRYSNPVDGHDDRTSSW